MDSYLLQMLESLVSAVMEQFEQQFLKTLMSAHQLLKMQWLAEAKSVPTGARTSASTDRSYAKEDALTRRLAALRNRCIFSARSFFQTADEKAIEN
ncbi:hypothetical protein TNCV_874321 [Trichonephila clavipes]|nr:hypothetical protein TNCV_874321 [Trichonephila clavipes]